jgi:hypothetical protein
MFLYLAMQFQPLQTGIVCYSTTTNLFKQNGFGTVHVHSFNGILQGTIHNLTLYSIGTVHVHSFNGILQGTIHNLTLYSIYTGFLACVNSVDPDQPAHLCNLNRI